MVSDTADRSLTFNMLITRTLWIMLVSDHTAQHRAIPSAEDCEGYRIFAELCTGDAVDHIDQRLRDSIAQRGQSVDPFLQEARALKRFAAEPGADASWQPAPLLVELAEAGKNFS